MAEKLDLIYMEVRFVGAAEGEPYLDPEICLICWETLIVNLVV
jgi:hypothetical protein